VLVGVVLAGGVLAGRGFAEKKPRALPTRDHGDWLIGNLRLPSYDNYSTQDGTARAGQDYTATSGQFLIPAGVGLATFVVPIHVDGLSDGTETVLLTLSQPSPDAVITQTNAVLSIVDTASQPASPTLTIRPDGRGGIVISWPATVGACVLEKSDTAAGGSWVAVSGVPHIRNGVYQVTELASAGQFFYRLRVL
jgi:Calx-beta domain